MRKRYANFHSYKDLEWWVMGDARCLLELPETCHFQPRTALAPSTRHHKNKWPELCSSNVVFNFLLIAKMQQHDSFNLPRPSSLWGEETIFLFMAFFQQPNPFCCNRSTTNLFMISFLNRTIYFFFFFLSLWIYLWLAETSQQPISQTTWLKVTPIVTIVVIAINAAF